MKTERMSGVLVVDIEYEQLVASNVDRFNEDIVPLIEQERLVVFDLQRLDFADSSGLGALLSCFRKVKAVGGELKLCNMNPVVRSLFELVRMHKVIDICNDPREAVKALAGEQ